MDMAGRGTMGDGLCVRCALAGSAGDGDPLLLSSRRDSRLSIGK